MLALLLLGLPWKYCMDGTGFGFPFAWFHPGHGEWGTFSIDGTVDQGNVIDLENLIASVFVLAVFAGAAALVVRRRSGRAPS